VSTGIPESQRLQGEETADDIIVQGRIGQFQEITALAELERQQDPEALALAARRLQLTYVVDISVQRGRQLGGPVAVNDDLFVFVWHLLSPNAEQMWH
jgi:hypothetical protein